MEVFQAHISTLFTLWNSLHVDTHTMDKKLSCLIVELERLISIERKDKILLAANIEDVMGNIEYASSLMGVSLENMLNSTVHDEYLTIDSITIYNTLNPSYPKEKVLIELNDRLMNEVTTRQCKVEEWLDVIHHLCIELDTPYRFQSVDEYTEHDLSWATLQSISCELRDLEAQKEHQVKEFEVIVRIIQYYWSILGHTPSTPLEESLGLLYHHIPVTITTDHPVIELDKLSYYQHPSHQLNLSKHTLSQLSELRNYLESVYHDRMQYYNTTIHQLNRIWDECDIPKKERPVVPTSIHEQDIQTLQVMLGQVDSLVKNTLIEYTEQFRTRLAPLWDAALISEADRKQFMDTLNTKKSKTEINASVNKHMTYLKTIGIEGLDVHIDYELTPKKKKMIDFEKTASDPKRLFQASFQLLEEEKWRNTCLPRLLLLDRSLIKAIQEYEQLTDKPVMIGSRRYLDTLLDEIADREANQTFFGFLTPDPQSTTAKRIKNRPVSAGSLGSVYTKKSLKKIQPSQSMPLHKIPNRSSFNSFITTTTTTTKAFRPGQLRESMIPIPSRPLTTTKSI
ncbi:microtubule associated protein-domain-containing protein [Pilobolus umbonatus]|nr:microtubule associated protein-domain-containing protein [Pilobolus umbonatus]